ncbi:hypothetical protein [Microbacterium sp. zg-YB36]|nr:hypothetical protein [Microbacterium sp. zg-YB36]MDL5350565.1 hypothetical protein [Microbacterium sp. zg-YB36]
MTSNEEIEAAIQQELLAAVKLDLTPQQVDAFEKKITTLRKLNQS